MKTCLSWLTLALSLPLTAAADDTVYASSFEPVWVLGYHVGYWAAGPPAGVVRGGCAGLAGAAGATATGATPT